MSIKHKLATVKSSKADVSSVSPSSEISLLITWYCVKSNTNNRNGNKIASDDDGVSRGVSYLD